MNFKKINLNEKIVKALEEKGYEAMTEIQEKAIPVVLEKKDMIGIAQTGSGKTAAFSIPLIERLIDEEEPNHVLKLLILTPTRELAIQIRDNLRDYIKYTNFKCGVVLGGVKMQNQIKNLKSGIDILVATPGRLMDLMKRKVVKLDTVKMLVLDEADVMLDMGFIKDIDRIVSFCPKTRQTLLFSATMSDKIRGLTEKFMKSPELIEIKQDSVVVDKIEQRLYYVEKRNKLNLILELLKEKKMSSVLVFTRTKRGANDLSKRLEEYGVKTSVIHSDKTQSNRVKALSDFKKGTTQFLIATDIASRGIDISGITHVINYDLPEQPEVYIHRIGRTARAGKSGVSMALCSPEERGKLRKIEELIKQKMIVQDHIYKIEEKSNKRKPKKNYKESYKSKRV